MQIKKSHEFRSEARNQLRGNWTPAVLITLIYGILLGIAAIPYIGAIVEIVIGGALALGVTLCFMKLVRGEEFKIEDMFSGFNNFASALLLNIVRGIFVFLWSLLLIVPGIIASFRYSMANYILNDSPKIGALESIRLSKEMMIGHKWQLFCLYFSFIGWYLLSIITLGIGFLWLTPYITTAVTDFYENLKMVNGDNAETL